jgi:thiol-disulfide isomerase/thioredoxin
MAEVYTNFAFDNFELNSETFINDLDAYAEQLEKTAKEYKNLAKIIKAKKIKILDAKGYAYAGSFSVDGIDAARLEKDGIVIDLNKDLPDEILARGAPTFYIDQELDQVIEKIDQEGVIGNDKEEKLTLANIDEDDIEEQSSLLNLVELLQDVELPEKISDKSEDFTPGTLAVDVKQVGEHQYSFNLTVADLNEDPVDVKFNREKGVFEYKCDSCDDIHTETISSVFRSLKTTNALLSNLIAVFKDSKELAVALEFIDHDLRLLQSLIAFDYALNDNEGVVMEHGEGCDHDHDQDEDLDEDLDDIDDEE